MDFIEERRGRRRVGGGKLSEQTGGKIVTYLIITMENATYTLFLVVIN